jgi:hypothetical protein
MLSMAYGPAAEDSSYSLFQSVILNSDNCLLLNIFRCSPEKFLELAFADILDISQRILLT